jgi:hypothetical protein
LPPTIIPGVFTTRLTSVTPVLTPPVRKVWGHVGKFDSEDFLLRNFMDLLNSLGYSFLSPLDPFSQPQINNILRAVSIFI